MPTIPFLLKYSVMVCLRCVIQYFTICFGVVVSEVSGVCASSCLYVSFSVADSYVKLSVTSI